MDLIHFVALNIVQALNEINKSDQRLEINKDYNLTAFILEPFAIFFATSFIAVPTFVLISY